MTMSCAWAPLTMVRSPATSSALKSFSFSTASAAVAEHLPPMQVMLLVGALEIVSAACAGPHKSIANAAPHITPARINPSPAERSMVERCSLRVIRRAACARPKAGLLMSPGWRRCAGSQPFDDGCGGHRPWVGQTGKTHASARIAERIRYETPRRSRLSRARVIARERRDQDHLRHRLEGAGRAWRLL